MRLTRACEYAIRCISYLSRIGTGVSVPKKEIAAYSEIPESFLAKIAQDLNKAGLIKIRQGSKGGYILLKAPEEITLLDVVEMMIGPIYLNDCVGRPSTCPASPRCLVHRAWDDASTQLRNTLAGVNFAEISKDEHCLPLTSMLSLDLSNRKK